MRIKSRKEVKEYLEDIDFSSNKTEKKAKEIFLENIQRYLNREIDSSFLGALSIELLYFQNSIGEFSDIRLRDALLYGDKLANLETFGVDSMDKESIINNIVKFLEEA